MVGSTPEAQCVRIARRKYAEVLGLPADSCLVADFHPGYHQECVAYSFCESEVVVRRNGPYLKEAE